MEFLFKVGYFILGLFLIFISIVIAGYVWHLLPPGIHLQIIGAIPAFPVIYLAWLCFKRCGITS